MQPPQWRQRTQPRGQHLPSWLVWCTFQFQTFVFPISFEKSRIQDVLKKMSNLSAQESQIAPSAKQIRGL